MAPRERKVFFCTFELDGQPAYGPRTCYATEEPDVWRCPELGREVVHGFTAFDSQSEARRAAIGIARTYAVPPPIVAA